MKTSPPVTPTTAKTIPMSSSTPPPSTSEPIAATPISSAPPPVVPVQLNPSKDSGKNIGGTSANPEEAAGAEQMEKKVDEAAAKKSKARSRDGEAKGKWWPCTTTENEHCNLEAKGFLQPGSWRSTPGAFALAPEAGEWVVTKALIERGFSLPPSDFFTEILQAYQLQPHNISPNNILAISNHATLCEGHLRDRLMCHYTGHDDLMRASKDNLSTDALDKRIRVLIKVPRDLRTHLEALEEKDLGNLTRVPHAGNTDPEAASDAEVPEAPAPAKRKRGASSGPVSKRAREAPSAAATRKAEREK
ncbi:hypothetical protein QYE76_031787 [Lolium multiflorum]|uniref:Transposase (putative) gypsy type domain-containing protein n=1 Tax=Lolium multiflorum TaxID=4521 RepID=A0AAD8QVM4_LOLMU|nr:hypothetical protein QYE76_031787 [Lolium multiflorum]